MYIFATTAKELVKNIVCNSAVAESNVRRRETPEFHYRCRRLQSKNVLEYCRLIYDECH